MKAMQKQAWRSNRENGAVRRTPLGAGEVVAHRALPRFAICALASQQSNLGSNRRALSETVRAPLLGRSTDRPPLKAATCCILRVSL